jgi:hypothetical protein
VVWDHRKTVESCTTLPRSDPTLQHDDVTCEASKVVCQILQVVPALRQHDGAAALVDRGDDVVEDQLVPRFVPCERSIQTLDARFGIDGLCLEVRLPADQVVREWPADCVAAWIDHVSHRATLHVDNRLLAVPSVGGRGQPDHEACPHLG